MRPSPDARASPAPAAPLVQLDGVGKTYRPFPLPLRALVRSQVRQPTTALADVSLTVDPGEICAVVGPNGAGKTTLFRVITGLTTPSAGAVHVAGIDPVTRGRAVRSLVGWMPADDRSLFLRQTCHENLWFHGRVHGLSTAALRRRIGEVLELVGLAEAAQQAAFTLSAGMRARLQLARALLHRPTLLVLDEPTGSVVAIERRPAPALRRAHQRVPKRRLTATIGFLAPSGRRRDDRRGGVGALAVAGRAAGGGGSPAVFGAARRVGGGRRFRHRGRVTPGGCAGGRRSGRDRGHRAAARERARARCRCGGLFAASAGAARCGTDAGAPETANPAPVVSLITAAAAKIAELVERARREAPDADLALRVAVQPGGCAGLHYALSVGDRRLPGDTVVEVAGVVVRVDPASAPHLAGVVIDWVDELSGAGFSVAAGRHRVRLRRPLRLTPAGAAA